MRRVERASTDSIGYEVGHQKVTEFPLPVAKDWDDLVARAEAAAEVIDRHLDYESKLQGRELRPITLCPEQRVSLASDLTAV